MITIIDYGVGNLGSIKNMLKRVGATCIISSDISDIEKAQKLILPGVGSFDTGMKLLKERKILDTLQRKVLIDRIPVLGVCLGMQLLMGGSEEGRLSGLGWIKGEVIKFHFNGQDNRLKIPHMGWNTIITAKPSPLLRGLDSESRFYFVHSFHVVCGDQEDILSRTEYGYPFVSALQKGNIMGVQFHPEKSHRFGMQILKNFAEIM
jgi:glutamine amidotransferase